MNWSAFFYDLQNWMIESNEFSQKYPITTDEYWEWLVSSIGHLGNKYNNHPLVNIFLSDLMKYQESNLKQVTGGKAI